MELYITIYFIIGLIVGVIYYDLHRLNTNFEESSLRFISFLIFIFWPIFLLYNVFVFLIIFLGELLKDLIEAYNKSRSA